MRGSAVELFTTVVVAVVLDVDDDDDDVDDDVMSSNLSGSNSLKISIRVESGTNRGNARRTVNVGAPKYRKTFCGDFFVCGGNRARR
jgi:hypothetical protein